MRRITYLIPAVVVVFGLLSSAIFVVDERERALVLQFGQIRQVIDEPGLNFRVPIIQEVIYYEDRILSLDTAATEVTPSDDRRLVVDAFARYRITDTRVFNERVGSGGIRRADDLIEDILNDRIRAVLGADGVTSNTILSEERAGLMQQITRQARARAASLGVEILDVRLKQTNLPAQNLDATFARMRAEREREAADEIARGEEAAQRIRATADRTVVELVSDATREAEITRGEADAERTRIFAEAFGQDTEFFDFTRSLTAYERALGDNTSFVISPDSEFFEYFDGSALGGGNSLTPAAE
ncbi:protease modulator HflC [Gymnodinialimonas sp. 57CJ19]|uniref:protease modulator HflC n=1 Tax=Gymnodinialimonas sp. 57CJ19 TaxID=3138498 RepID=UPI00313443F4